MECHALYLLLLDTVPFIVMIGGCEILPR